MATITEKPYAPSKTGWQAFVDKIKNLINNHSNQVSITWAKLKDLRDNSKLIPGKEYRITDYLCTTIQENTLSAEHQFDIIVTADSKNTLNEDAKAAIHEGDTYFQNNKLDAWKIKYRLDNDYQNFLWTAAIHNNLIKIYDYNLWFEYKSSIKIEGLTYHLWYNKDFISTNGTDGYIATDSDTPDVETCVSLVSIDTPEITEECWETIDKEIYACSEEGTGVIYLMIDEYDNECPYDFKNIQFKRWKIQGTSSSQYPSYSTIYIAYSLGILGLNINSSDFIFSYTFNFFDGESKDNSLLLLSASKNNKIGKWFFDTNTQLLNNITFYNTSSGLLLTDNIISDNCYNISYYGNSYFNQINKNCHNILLSGKINKICMGCNDLQIAGTSYNIFNEACLQIYLKYGASCNIFNTECSGIFLGLGSNHNNFGIQSRLIFLGNYCTYNNFGSGCYKIYYGTSSTDLYNYFHYNTIEPGVCYLYIVNINSLSSANPIKNIRIRSGFRNINAGSFKKIYIQTTSYSNFDIIDISPSCSNGSVFYANNLYSGTDVISYYSSGSLVGGYHTQTNEKYSHAEGCGTVPYSNMNSYAISDSTRVLASNMGSHAEGWATVAEKVQHVEGVYNISDTGTSSKYPKNSNFGKYAHIIGNGAYDTGRSNAETLDWSGNLWVAGDVLCGGTSMDDPLYRLSQAGGVLINEITYTNLVSAINNGTLSKGGLYLLTDYICTSSDSDILCMRNDMYIFLLAVSTTALAPDGYAIPKNTDLFNTKNIYKIKFNVLGDNLGDKGSCLNGNTFSITKTRTLYLLPNSAYHGSMAVGNGLILVGRDNSDVHYSYRNLDGTGNETVTSTSKGNRFFFDTNSNLFICVGLNTIGWSEDGKTWTTSTTLPPTGMFPSGTSTLSLLGILGPDRFIVFGAGYTGVTLDGKTWLYTAQSISAKNRQSANRGAYGKDKNGNDVYLFHNQDTFIYSNDGITWETYMFSYTLPSGSNFSIGYGNGMFIFTTDDYYTYFSYDGKTWSRYYNNLHGLEFHGIAYIDNYFIGSGSYGMYVSKNGLDWSSKLLSTYWNVYVIYNDEIYYTINGELAQNSTVSVFKSPTLNSITFSGAITEMEDEYGNKVAYDFKNIRIKGSDGNYYYTFDMDNGLDSSKFGLSTNNVIAPYFSSSDLYNNKLILHITNNSNIYNCKNVELLNDTTLNLLIKNIQDRSIEVSKSNLDYEWRIELGLNSSIVLYSLPETFTTIAKALLELNTVVTYE